LAGVGRCWQSMDVLRTFCGPTQDRPRRSRSSGRMSPDRTGRLRTLPDLVAPTLNPRVRGSSPWRRTRSDLHICTPAVPNRGRPVAVAVAVGAASPWRSRSTAAVGLLTAFVEARRQRCRGCATSLGGTRPPSYPPWRGSVLFGGPGARPPTISPGRTAGAPSCPSRSRQVPPLGELSLSATSPVWAAGGGSRTDDDHSGRERSRDRGSHE
jgi:hypothetical protein